MSRTFTYFEGPAMSTCSMTGFAEQLACRPDHIARLLAEHVPDETSRCRGCTRPGTGAPWTPWPCALHFYASTARAIRRRAAGHG